MAHLAPCHVQPQQQGHNLFLPCQLVHTLYAQASAGAQASVYKAIAGAWASGWVPVRRTDRAGMRAARRIVRMWAE